MTEERRTQILDIMDRALATLQPRQLAGGEPLAQHTFERVIDGFRVSLAGKNAGSREYAGCLIWLSDTKVYYVRLPERTAKKLEPMDIAYLKGHVVPAPAVPAVIKDVQRMRRCGCSG